MAATGFTPVYIYASGTTGNIPSASNLTNTTNGSEIALNYFDGKLFYKNASNSVVTVPLLQSSGSQNGWLSSTDWTTFNNKQPAGTYVTSVTGTSPVVSSGGTTPAISMAAATGSVNGYLTSTDWTTFNGKQAALVSGTNIKTVSGTTLLGSGDLGTIGTGYGGTGLTSFTAKGVVYASSTSALATGSGFQFDGTNGAIGITPSAWNYYKGFQVGYGALASISGNDTVVFSNAYYDGTNNYRYLATGYASQYRQVNGLHAFYVAASGNAADPISFTQAFTVQQSGGVSIGNTTDPGAANLSVSGNVVIATSGKGIDFSATPGTGTSELLADYEEGTWTPTTSGITIVGTDTSTYKYTKIGNMVTLSIQISGSTSVATSFGATISLPFSRNANSAFGGYAVNINSGQNFQYSMSGTTNIFCSTGVAVLAYNFSFSYMTT